METPKSALRHGSIALKLNFNNRVIVSQLK